MDLKEILDQLHSAQKNAEQMSKDVQAHIGKMSTVDIPKPVSTRKLVINNFSVIGTLMSDNKIIFEAEKATELFNSLT